jgi:Leucine rich repeat
MLAQVLFFIMWSFRLTSATVFCESNKTQFCFVRNQKVLASETFQVSRSTAFTDLILSDTEMPFLPSTIFISYPSITFLSASNNGLKELRFKNFANSGKLKKLFLSYGDISKITNGTFRSCVSLENLQLCHHKISTVSGNAFQGLTNLLSLHLINNSIEFLHPSIFSMLPKLNILMMEMNMLKSLSSNLFKANAGLIVASFTNNHLSELASDLFASNSQIQSLNFDQNFLQSAITFGCPYVDLSSNRLTQLRFALGTQTLHINNNFIEVIECDGTDLSSLKKLYASNNSLTNFKCIRDMENLTDLDLSANNFPRPAHETFKKLIDIRDFRIYDQKHFSKVAAKTFSSMRSISALRIDRLVDYRNLRQIFPNITQIALNTKTWNCSYTQQVAKALARQKILMNYNNLNDRLLCNIKQNV